MEKLCNVNNISIYERKTARHKTNANYENLVFDREKNHGK